MARVEAEPTVCIADTTAGKELLIMIQTAEDPITFSPGGLWYVRVELFLAATLLSTAHSQGVIHFNCFTYDTLSSAGYKTPPHPSLVSSHPHRDLPPEETCRLASAAACVIPIFILRGCMC